MKQLRGLLLLILVEVIGLFIGNYKYNEYLAYLEEQRDKEAPVIRINKNDLFFFDTDEINFFDYIEVSDNSGEYTVEILNEDEAKLPGQRKVVFEAKDAEGNSVKASIRVTIESAEDFNNYVASRTFNYVYRRIENDYFLEQKGHPDYDAFELALKFVGMPGACSEVAQAFINAYFGYGYSVFNTYPVSYEEARPGDIIYYADGGIGLQHYATYLGGSSALQGNINGTTVIGNVYMSHGSTPQFQRLVGIE